MDLKVVSKKQMFNIADDSGQVVQVEGRLTNIGDVDCFIRFDEETNEWIISHLESGCVISKNKSKVAAGLSAIFTITNHPDIAEKAKEMVIKAGFDYPLNQVK